jgi:hypothetical protein
VTRRPAGPLAATYRNPTETPSHVALARSVARAAAAAAGYMTRDSVGVGLAGGPQTRFKWSAIPTRRRPPGPDEFFLYLRSDSESARASVRSA